MTVRTHHDEIGVDRVSLFQNFINNRAGRFVQGRFYAGLLDFPAILGNEEVYLCWRVGEDRIRFYHRRDEGFDGRRPLDPRDAGPAPPVH